MRNTIIHSVFQLNHAKKVNFNFKKMDAIQKSAISFASFVVVPLDSKKINFPTKSEFEVIFDDTEEWKHQFLKALEEKIKLIAEEICNKNLKDSIEDYKNLEDLITTRIHQLRRNFKFSKIEFVKYLCGRQLREYKSLGWSAFHKFTFDYIRHLFVFGDVAFSEYLKLFEECFMDEENSIDKKKFLDKIHETIRFDQTYVIKFLVGRLETEFLKTTCPHIKTSKSFKKLIFYTTILKKFKVFESTTSIDMMWTTEFLFFLKKFVFCSEEFKCNATEDFILLMKAVNQTAIKRNKSDAFESEENLKNIKLCYKFLNEYFKIVKNEIDFSKFIYEKMNEYSVKINAESILFPKLK